MSLKLYSTCISVLQNFGFFFRPPPKLLKFTKFRRNFGEILNPDRCAPIRSAARPVTYYLTVIVRYVAKPIKIKIV